MANENTNYRKKYEMMKVGSLRSSGFTIIETLVAITVLMIAVAGPLSVAAKGLRAALYARDQMVATFLAQESMESIKNLRDNNIASGSNWLAQFGGCLNENQKCDATAAENSGGATIKNQCPATGYPIQLDFANNRYVPLTTCDADTLFKRYFYIQDISAVEKKVIVRVQWTTMNLPNQVELISIITSGIR